LMAAAAAVKGEICDVREIVGFQSRQVESELG